MLCFSSISSTSDPIVFSVCYLTPFFFLLCMHLSKDELMLEEIMWLNSRVLSHFLPVVLVWQFTKLSCLISLRFCSLFFSFFFPIPCRNFSNSSWFFSLFFHLSTYFSFFPWIDGFCVLATVLFLSAYFLTYNAPSFFTFPFLFLSALFCFI